MFDIISVFATVLTDKNIQIIGRAWQNCTESLDDLLNLKAKFKILFDGYRKMIDQSFSTFKELSDMLRFLPGVVVQRDALCKYGMAALYRIKPDFLERLIKSIIESLKPSSPSNPSPRCVLGDYLFNFLQDRDRSRLYYCDPMLQHISICHHFLSFLDESNAFDPTYVFCLI